MRHLYLRSISQKTVLLRRKRHEFKRRTGHSCTRTKLKSLSRENVKVLKSHPLPGRLTRRESLAKASSESSSSERKESGTPKRPPLFNGRRRLMEAIRKRRRTRVPIFVKYLTPLMTDVHLNRLWTSLCASFFATGLYCGSRLATVALGEKLGRPLQNWSIGWPLCVCIGGGVMFFYQTHVHHKRALETQKTWFKILGKGKDLMRMCMTSLATTMEKRRIGKWILVFLFSLRSQLMSDDVIHDYLCSTLTPVEFFAIVESKDRVTLALQVLTDLIAQNCVDVYLAASMNAAVNSLSTYTTTLLSLTRTPTLNSQNKFGERLVQIWITVFSFLSLGSVGPWSIPLTAVFAYWMTAFEEHVKDLKDPLQSLNLERDCFVIRDSVDQIHLDYANMRRVTRGSGFTTSSNVIPADGLTGELGSNTTTP